MMRIIRHAGLWVGLWFLLWGGIGSALSADVYEVEFQKNVMVSMSDGIHLAANLFLPKADGPFPVLLMRSPYGKGDEKMGDCLFYGGQGYAVMIQDTRGRGDSEGEWNPFFLDGRDGYETQEWIGKQTWCNGKIGTFGGSYVGFTQWISAPFASQYLKAMVPEVPFSDAYHHINYQGGAYQVALTFLWGTMVSKDLPKPFEVKWDEGFRHLPLMGWKDYLGFEVKYINDWLSHPTYDDYWKARGVDNRYGDITVPILNIGGWYDIFARDTIDMINRVRHESKDHAARRNQLVIMGPWHHGGSDKGKVGELDFGRDADLDRRPLRLKWFDYWLKNQDTGVEDWPPFYLFIMGENVWRSENEWPLQRTQWTDYYLHSGGKANTRQGDGVLNTVPPLVEESDTFVYDPADPVPSKGGNHLGNPVPGPFEQSEVENRQDVLVYTTPALEHDVEVTGPIKMVLFASSTATDTDFTAKLVDVHEDGKAFNLCDGIIRARYRSSETEASLIESGKIYRYEIDLWVTSNLFRQGHRIRVEISSSNFPRFDRNPNTGHTFAVDADMVKATQAVLHGAEYPSHLVLPVIPR